MSTRRTFITVLSSFAAVCAFAQMVKADTQDFSSPNYKGHLLDWCFTWAADCGQHPADAWCKVKGFDGAQSFQKWDNPGQATRLIGSNQVCDEPECDSYTKITCESADSQEETFKRPKFKGTRLDWCLTWGQNCGKPAADAYCDWKGYSQSTNFEIANDIGHTRIISTGQVCNDPTCDGFKYISCK